MSYECHCFSQSCTQFSPITILDGSLIPAKSYGNVFLSPSVILNNFLYIPSFTCNLISISKLTKALHCAAHFFPSFYALQDLATRKLIGMGELRDGLYYFRAIKIPIATTNITHDSKLNLWHQRLGHLPFDRLSLITDLGQFSVKSFNKCCDSYHRAKQSRTPFPVSSIKTHESFELIHCDVWGPYHTASLSSAHYFLSIVDDYTRVTWVYLLRTKSEVFLRLLSFMTMVTRKFGKVVKQIRSDNGTEFTNHNFQLFCQKNGILT
ncbi:hypothetical protein Patl1_37243 [Pistacia atlantica]|nr:hypothetical protein Patl1_37243 [Pistacia atlantica]